MADSSHKSGSSTFAGNGAVLAVYTATVFAGAVAMFWLEPMVARQLLPALGGNAAVWNTCLVFFQLMLLAGYAYALVLARWLHWRGQAAVHTVLLAAAALTLPPLAATAGISAERPVPGVLMALMAGIGLPFFALSAQGPVLQRWFARSRHRQAHDPYFLYAASNLGSLLALLGYPLLIESIGTLADQRRWWTWVYTATVILTALSAVAVWRTPGAADQAARTERAAAPAGGSHGPGWAQRGRWCLWSAVPSALLMAVTSYIASDLAAVPLFWILPLAIYLLTFVAVFSRVPWLRDLDRRILTVDLLQRGRDGRGRFLPLLAAGGLLAGVVVAVSATSSVFALVGLHLLLFLVVTYTIHARLAADRPPVRDLAQYYLWIGAGGALGGVAMLLVAPLVFVRLHEYPVVLALAVAIQRPREPGKAWLTGRDALMLAVVGGLAGGGLLLSRVGPVMSLLPAGVDPRVLLAAPALALLPLRRRPQALGLGLALTLGLSAYYPTPAGETVAAVRSFYGRHRVLRDDRRGVIWLEHGNTVHGGQRLAPERSHINLTYFSASGPAGDILAYHAATAPEAPVAVIGLGAGEMAAYARPGQAWTFFELDPAVAWLARDSGHFSWLGRGGVSHRIVLGDGRLRLAEEPAGTFGLIVVDAFGSDAIPVHLLTREALRIYRDRLRPGGVLAFHISNRYLDLGPVLGALAADMGWPAWERVDIRPPGGDEVINSSHWVMMAAGLDRPPVPDTGWTPLAPPDGGGGLWTDDFSSLLVLMGYNRRD